MSRKINITETVKVAWKSLIAEIWLLVGLVIGYVIIVLFLGLFAPDPTESITATGIAMAILSTVFSLIFSLGYTKNLFQALDKDEPQFSAYGQQSLKIITYFIAYLLFFVIVCIGLVLFIIPGIYLAIRLQFYTASIVDEKTGIIESLKRSWEITKGQTKPLILLMFINIGLILLGILAFGIGIFITIPLIGLINCYAFRKLTIPIE